MLRAMLAESSSGRGTSNGESMRKEIKWPSQKNGITLRMRTVLVPPKSKHQLANGAASQCLRYIYIYHRCREYIPKYPQFLRYIQKYPKIHPKISQKISQITSNYSEPLMWPAGSPFGRSRRPAVATATGMSVPDPGQLRWCRRSLPPNMDYK